MQNTRHNEIGNAMCWYKLEKTLQFYSINDPFYVIGLYPIPTENIKKSLDFLCFQGHRKKQWHEWVIGMTRMLAGFLYPVYL